MQLTVPVRSLQLERLQELPQVPTSEQVIPPQSLQVPRQVVHSAAWPLIQERYNNG